MVADLRRAFNAGKAVVKKHAQWWNPEMKSRLGTQARKDPSKPGVADGMEAVRSAWVAEESSRILGLESTGEREKMRRDLVSDAKDRRLSAWKQFELSSPIREGARSKATVDTR